MRIVGKRCTLLEFQYSGLSARLTEWLIDGLIGSIWLMGWVKVFDEWIGWKYLINGLIEVFDWWIDWKYLIDGLVEAFDWWIGWKYLINGLVGSIGLKDLVKVFD